MSQNYINHIAFVLDASGSMYRHKNSLIKVADAQIANLAQRSKELNQETRVTVYTFASRPQCIIYDKDVLRLPSIAQHYQTGGNTALIDATLLSLTDLKETPEKYGDHSFLVFVLTDGQENASQATAAILKAALNGLPDHWTVATLVPDALSKHEAKRFGFAPDNIAVWDATTQQGLEEAVQRISTATDSYMTARATGVRGTRSLFSTAPSVVNKQTVSAAGLKELDPDKFFLVPVPQVSVIKDFVESTGRRYELGRTFYQLVKRESIQPNKNIAVVEKKTAKVFMGREARQLIGLPDVEVRVSPDHNPEFEIYVQSTSVNRKLPAHSRILLLV